MAVAAMLNFIFEGSILRNLLVLFGEWYQGCSLYFDFDFDFDSLEMIEVGLTG